MSNPRYRPRDFAVHPRDFGRRPEIEWREPEDGWSMREAAQLSAAQLQHRLCYGVLEVWMPKSETKKMTTLARAIDVPYGRLQRVLTGHLVMQFEDFGRLHAHIGPRVELWLLSGRNAQIARAVAAVHNREAEASKAALAVPPRR